VPEELQNQEKNLRKILTILGLAVLLVLAAIGAGGTVGYVQHKFPSTACMVLDVIGLCK
jgi:hypothetical protein